MSVFQREPNKIQFISIEGNIGAGKSTLFHRISNYLDEYELNKDKHILFLREPVDIWENIRNEYGKNILNLFYENPAKYAFEFQTMVLATQYRLIDETLRDNSQCSIIISERSIETGHQVFTKMLVEDGFITSVQYEIYKIMLENYLNLLHNNHTNKPDKIIYLDVEPEVCKKRVDSRSREGEELISLNYLQSCKKYYDKWLNEEIANKVVKITDNRDVHNIVKYII